jgi:CheY-like chemotaxis protein
MYRILVIDDSKAIAERLQNSLQQEGYEVNIASNGQNGLEIIRDYVPDLVITDILMPVMDGVEVVLYLKKNYPKIKVIAMTSGGYIKAGNHLQVIKQLGADYTLVKPFRDNYLKNIILSLNSKKSL